MLSFNLQTWLRPCFEALSILIKTVLYAPIANSKGLDATAFRLISPVLQKKVSQNSRGGAIAIS